MVKLTTRFSSPAEIAKLNAMISSFNTSMVLELQQRATEYTTLGQPQWSSLRNDVLAGMPAIDASKVRSRNENLASSAVGSADLLGDDDAGASSSSGTAAAAPKPVQAAQSSAGASLLDLDDIFGGGTSTSSAGTAMSASSSAPAAPPAVDLLADIFSSGPAAPAPATASFGSSNGGAPAPGANDLLGLMDFGAPAPAPAPPVANPPLRAYEKNGLTVDLEITKPNPDDKSVTYITATTRNSTAMSIDKFVFLAAFPKYIKLKMEPPTGDVVPPNNSGVVTQVVKIQNSMQGEVSLLLKCWLAGAQRTDPNLHLLLLLL